MQRAVKYSILTARAGWILFYPAFIAVVSAPAVRVLGLKGAVELAVLALAWFAFTRLLLIFYVGSVVSNTRAASSYIVLAVCGAVIDSGGVIAATWFDHRLIWSAVAAIVFTEPVLWWHEATRSPRTSKA